HRAVAPTIRSVSVSVKINRHSVRVPTVPPTHRVEAKDGRISEGSHGMGKPAKNLLKRKSRIRLKRHWPVLAVPVSRVSLLSERSCAARSGMILLSRQKKRQWSRK